MNLGRQCEASCSEFGSCFLKCRRSRYVLILQLTRTSLCIDFLPCDNFPVFTGGYSLYMS